VRASRAAVGRRRRAAAGAYGGCNDLPWRADWELAAGKHCMHRPDTLCMRPERIDYLSFIRDTL